MPMPHVLVLGLGPSGRSVAHRLAAHGIEVTAVDRSPDRIWTPTYAAWADELPGWLPTATIATRDPQPRAWAGGEHRIERTYCVLDTPVLQSSLDLSEVEVLTGTVDRLTATTATLTDGRELSADLVLDARGTAPAPALAQQTAVGVVIDRGRLERVAGAWSNTWFMDWRSDHGADGPPTSYPSSYPSFLYVVALDEQRMLLEETCLVGRPALDLAELQRRLRHRLRSRGLDLTGEEPVERVRFAVEPDRSPAPAIALGARGGLMHPATGYSVATGLSVADRVVAAVLEGADPRRRLWSPAARATDRLRRAGLRTLLQLPGDEVETFFAAFFRLSPALQRTYLSERDDPVRLAWAMASMARHLPPRLSRIAVASTLSGR